MSGGKCEVAQKRRACLVAFYPSLGLGCVFFSFSPWLWSLNSRPIFPLACVDLSLEAQGRKGQEKLQTLLTTAAACLGGGVSQGDGGQQHLGGKSDSQDNRIENLLLWNGIDFAKKSKLA